MFCRIFLLSRAAKLRRAAGDIARAWPIALGGLCLLVVVGIAEPAWGQRVQFPSPVEPGVKPAAVQPPGAPPTSPPGGWGPAGGAPAPQAAPPVGGYGAPPSGYAPPSYTPPPAYTPPSYPPPSYPSGAPAPYPPPGAPATPPAGLQNSIAPPGGDWYANPNSMPPPGGPYYTTPPAAGSQPGALFPGGAANPNIGSPNAAGNFGGFGPDSVVGQMQRFLHEIGFEFSWLSPGSGDGGFGITSSETHASFAVPLFNSQPPFIVTPGFAIHFLQGPSEDGADLPPQLYDAYLDFGWKPTITQWLSADLGFRTGVYSDFAHTNTDSIRLMGRGLGIVQISPKLQAVAGIVYLDRLQIKLLPAGGLIWTPNPDARYEILFPRPKLARRWINLGTTEWWWYVAGEYGGGSWTVERDGNIADRIDYNDVRALLGVEWKAPSGLRGYFEVGYVFSREIFFDVGPPDSFNPNSTIMLRAGVNY